MRRNPIYNSDNEEDENLQRLSSIYTIADDIETREPEVDYDLPDPDPVNTLYLMPTDRPETGEGTSEQRIPDLRARNLVQVPGPDGVYTDGKLYFETVNGGPDDGPREVYVFQQSDEESEASDGDRAFDPENTLYLSPLYQPSFPVTSQPLSSDKLAQTLVNISGPEGRSPDGKMYFKPVIANEDGGPNIVYVLEPPDKEEPPPVIDPPREPPPQNMNRTYHFWEGRRGPVEVSFSSEDIIKASPNWFKIFKRAFSVLFIVIEYIGEIITLSSMYSHHEAASGTSNFFDWESQHFQKSSFECDSAHATSSLTSVYTAFVFMQGIFCLIRILNVIGETISDVKGGGFQIIHGWDETAFGLLMIDIPETIILIAFIDQCSKKPTTRWLFITPIISLIKNITRKNTTRQKPGEEVSIPLICFSLVLIDKNGKFNCSFKPRPWRICLPAFFWEWNLYKDTGLCSNEKDFCGCSPKEWNCLTFSFCCWKIKCCTGNGCQNVQCCKAECDNSTSCAICSLLLLIIRIIFLIIIWFFKILFNVLSHIFSRLSSE